MPSLKSIRKRITSVKNTQKITRAMKLVAAAKLRRAQDSIIAARPYSASLRRVVSELAAAAGEDAHALFEEREGERASIIVLTSDRGLAGAFNSQVLRKVEAFVESDLSTYSDVSLRIVGRKANSYFTRRHANISSYDAAPTSVNANEFSHEMSARVIEDFLEKRVDRVFIVYNEFRSALSQDVTVKQVLPVKASVPAEGEAVDYIYEPTKEELLSHIVPLFVQNGIFLATLDSIASELGARMTSMGNATKNAGEMIGRLTLQYNRARQAAITKELLEIISGAEALKG